MEQEISGANNVITAFALYFLKALNKYSNNLAIIDLVLRVLG